MLGDIFHSSPVVVYPPLDKFLCYIGVCTQCVRPLYARKDKTGLDSTPMLERNDLPASCNDSTPERRDAYDESYRRYRQVYDALKPVFLHG